MSKVFKSDLDHEGTHPDFPAMKFKVSVSTKKDEVQQSKNDRASKMKGRAKERPRLRSPTLNAYKKH